MATQRVAVVCDFSIGVAQKTPKITHGGCEAKETFRQGAEVRGRRVIFFGLAASWPRAMLPSQRRVFGSAKPTSAAFRAVRGVVRSMVYQWTTLRPHNRPRRQVASESCNLSSGEKVMSFLLNISSAVPIGPWRFLRMKAVVISGWSQSSL